MPKGDEKRSGNGQAVSEIVDGVGEEVEITGDFLWLMIFCFLVLLGEEARFGNIFDVTRTVWAAACDLTVWEFSAVSSKETGGDFHAFGLC